MSRFIVCSDIHGRSELFKRVLTTEKEAEGVLIAGDIELDPAEVAEMIYSHIPGRCSIYAVAGNCDTCSPAAGTLRPLAVADIGSGNKVFLTHGHRYSVPRTDILSYAAEEQGCNIVIFGHTHQFFLQKEAGILFMNPGALRNGEYAILTVGEDGGVNVTRKSIL